MSAALRMGYAALQGFLAGYRRLVVELPLVGTVWRIAQVLNAPLVVRPSVLEF